MSARPGEATLRRLLSPMAAALADPDTREVVVNRPGRFGVEDGGGWRWHEAPELDFATLDAIGILAARLTGQDFGEENPSCSSRLPDGERITMARPPVAPEGSVQITIRKRAKSFVPTLEWLEERGYFAALPQVEGGWAAWFRRKVEGRATIVCTGETGSGKTTMAEACIRAIPLDSRIVTLESVPEWLDLPHENWIPHLYAQDGQDRRGARTAEQVLALVLRERPDRILFGEMRTGEAWAYLRALRSGHRGGISTAHAEPGYAALEDVLLLMVRENRSSDGVPDGTVRALLRQSIDVVVHCARTPEGFRATSVDEVPR